MANRIPIEDDYMNKANNDIPFLEQEKRKKGFKVSVLFLLVTIELIQTDR